MSHNHTPIHDYCEKCHKDGPPLVVMFATLCPKCMLVLQHAPALLASLKEMRDACAAAMRNMERFDISEFTGTPSIMKSFCDELEAMGMEPGFGVRADAAIQKAEGNEKTKT